MPPQGDGTLKIGTSVVKGTPMVEVKASIIVVLDMAIGDEMLKTRASEAKGISVVDVKASFAIGNSVVVYSMIVLVVVSII